VYLLHAQSGNDHEGQLDGPPYALIKRQSASLFRHPPQPTGGDDSPRPWSNNPCLPDWRPLPGVCFGSDKGAAAGYGRTTALSLRPMAIPSGGTTQDESHTTIEDRSAVIRSLRLLVICSCRGLAGGLRLSPPPLDPNRLSRDDCLKDVQWTRGRRPWLACDQVVAQFPQESAPLDDRFGLHSLNDDRKAACRDNRSKPPPCSIAVVGRGIPAWALMFPRPPRKLPRACPAAQSLR